MRAEPAFMLAIAAAVADGSPVDWDTAEAQATSVDDKEVLRSLRLLSQVATLHDSMDEDGDAPVLRASAARTPDGWSAPQTLLAWGRYDLREQLGAGGQGAVYRAWDPQLECEVALKVLHPRLAAADRVGERMLREGRALAKVRHPHVVNVYAAEEHEGQIGLCMEFIRGRTLEEIFKAQGPFGQAEAVTVGLNVVRALLAVHAAGLVHRDVKARNVMREEGGRIVLMDFGTGRDPSELAGAGAGGLAGTPLYMAPEVLAGDAASEQSDIYSVGVLLYYLLTGQYPVEGKSIGDIIQSHVRGRRTPLAERRADLSGAFIRIVDRALAADPDARHESAAMLVHDLVSIESQDNHPQAPRTVAQRVLLGAAWSTMAAVGITLLGLLTSLEFNYMFERGGYSHETPLSWLVWGLRALVGPFAFIAQLVIEALLVTAGWRLARRWVPAFDHMAARLTTRATRLSRRIGLSHVDSFGQIALLATVVYLCLVVVAYSSLISAMMASVTTLTPEQRTALSPLNRTEYIQYRSWLDILVVVASFASLRLARMRRQQRTEISAALLTALVAVLGLTTVMWIAPYRVLMQSEMNRVNLAGQRCFSLGHEAASTLVYCPDSPQPKVHHVADGDPTLEDAGFTQSVFSPQ